MKRYEPHEIAISMIENRTRTAAAKALHIDERTLYNYLQSYEVQSCIRQLKADYAAAQLAELEEARAAAIDTIKSICTDESQNALIRLKAAGMLLSQFGSANEAAAKADCTAVSLSRTAERDEMERNGVMVFP